MFAPTLAQRDMRSASGREKEAWINGGVGHVGPHCTWVQIDASDSMKIHNYLLHTPIHETLDRWYLVATRNNLLDSRYDSTFADRSAYIAGQDQYVLEPLHPKLTPHNNAHEFFVPADKAIARYRALTAANHTRSSADYSAPIPLAAGGRYYIEVRHKQADQKDNVAVAWQPPGGERAVIGGMSWIIVKTMFGQAGASVNINMGNTINS